MALATVTLPNGQEVSDTQLPSAIQSGQANDKQALKSQLDSVFQGSSYASSPELQNILNQWSNSGSYANYSDKPGWANAVKTAVDSYAGTFDSMFKNQVGRAPTAEEYDTFFKSVVTPSKPWDVDYATQTDLTRQRTSGLLSDVFSSAAQDEAANKLKRLGTEATAPGSAFDTWSQSYGNSINDVEKSLLDYQTRLFEKIRPQLLTSLHSQGLLNTGALNKAYAGVEGDLASTGANYIAGLKGQAAQDIANQKYALQSAPTTYQLNTTAANPGNMLSSGSSALQNVWNNYMQNQTFAQQNKLLEAQQADQPSLLQQYGGLMLGGMAGGWGQGLGTQLAKG